LTDPMDPWIPRSRTDRQTGRPIPQTRRGASIGSHMRPLRPAIRGRTDRADRSITRARLAATSHGGVFICWGRGVDACGVVWRIGCWRNGTEGGAASTGDLTPWTRPHLLLRRPYIVGGFLWCLRDPAARNSLIFSS
jgi:hypothetical protein